MSEEKAVWYKLGDSGTCRTCGGGVVFLGDYWDHLDADTQCKNLDVILDSVKRKTAVCCGQCDQPAYPPSWDDIDLLPTYNEWLDMMVAAGWFGSIGNGWVTVRPIPRTMSHGDAMEWFRIGLCPPRESGERLPFDEEVNDGE